MTFSKAKKNNLAFLRQNTCMKKIMLAGIASCLAVIPQSALPCSADITNSATVSVTVTKPEISAVAAVVTDLETGKIYYSKNAEQIRPMASLTKVMTTILTLEAGDLDTAFTVDSSAVHVEGTTMGLRENDVVTRRALCYGMMLPSGNDASNVAAVSVSGSIGEFVKLMNSKAAELGMKNTSFANPHGLDQVGHHSTALDMAVLTAYALRNETFRDICRTESIRLQFGNPPYGRWLKNNNKMLSIYDNAQRWESIGVKTGFTDSARRCLISAAEVDGRVLIVVTLNAADDWNDHVKLLNHGYEMSEVLYANYV